VNVARGGAGSIQFLLTVSTIRHNDVTREPRSCKYVFCAQRAAARRCPQNKHFCFLRRVPEARPNPPRPFAVIVTIVNTGKLSLHTHTHITSCHLELHEGGYRKNARRGVETIRSDFTLDRPPKETDPVISCRGRRAFLARLDPIGKVVSLRFLWNSVKIILPSHQNVSRLLVRHMYAIFSFWRSKEKNAHTVIYGIAL
jgi:hypothetical protein